MSTWTSSLAKATKRFSTASAAQIQASGEALLADARAASKLRSYQRDTNVLALSIERTRDRLDRWGWLAVIAGLGFTTVTVALFIGGPTGWLVEPMIMGLLLVLMRGEQVAARHQEPTNHWVVNTRRLALGVTYVMNTWDTWVHLDPKQIFIHSVPPIMVFFAAEALARQRVTLTRVADRMGGLLAPSRAPSVLQLYTEPPLAPPRPTLAQDAPTVDETPTVELELPEVPAARTEELSAPLPRGEGKRRMQAAFAKLAATTPVELIRPADVDKAAEVKAGSAKKVMDKLREHYLSTQEVSDGDLANAS